MAVNLQNILRGKEQLALYNQDYLQAGAAKQGITTEQMYANVLANPKVAKITVQSYNPNGNVVYTDSSNPGKIQTLSAEKFYNNIVSPLSGLLTGLSRDDYYGAMGKSAPELIDAYVTTTRGTAKSLGKMTQSEIDKYLSSSSSRSGQKIISKAEADIINKLEPLPVGATEAQRQARETQISQMLSNAGVTQTFDQFGRPVGRTEAEIEANRRANYEANAINKNISYEQIYGQKEQPVSQANQTATQQINPYKTTVTLIGPNGETMEADKNADFNRLAELGWTQQPSQTQSAGGATGTSGTYGATSGSAGGTTNFSSFSPEVQAMIQNNPILGEILSDPQMSSYFSSLDSNLQTLVLQSGDYLQKAIDEGKVVNPNIDLEPSMVEQFLNQATEELDPYYKEQIGYIQKDLKRSIDRMQTDYLTSVGRTEEAYKLQLKQQAEDEAQSGMTFSSGRKERLDRTIQQQQNDLDDASLNMARNIEDQAISAERNIGSKNLAATGIDYGVNKYTASQTGFSGAGQRIFTPQGNLLGELPKQRTVDISNRQNELVTNEKQQRILDFSALGGGNALAATRYSSQLTPVMSSSAKTSTSTPSSSDSRYWSINPNNIK